MKEPEYFQTIKERTEGVFKDRGSKFFGYAFPVKNEDEVQSYLQELKKEHIKSRHVCYAYRLGYEGDQFRINDDGEPSGTAGKPIYGCLLKFDLTDTLIAVVRYFGGTKLGVPGLIHAYREASMDALSTIELERHLIGTKISFLADYSIAANIVDEGKKLDMELIDQTFTDQIETVFLIPKADQEQRILFLLKRLTNLDFDTVEGYGDVVRVTGI